MQKFESVSELCATLNTRGVHTALKTATMEVTGRSCTAYLPIGMFSLIDIMVIVIEKQHRRKGECRQFLSALLDVAEHDERDAVRFMNLINPTFEDFLIRVGFRLMGTADYILLRADFDAARKRIDDTDKPVY